MFYTKTRLNEDTVLETDIKQDNVFCRCPRCNREVRVDLAAFAGDEDFEPFDSAVLCEECTEAFLKEEEAE